MSYNRRKSGIGITVALVGLAVALLATTGWIGIKNKEQKENLKTIQEKASTLEASKDQITEQVDAIKEKNQQLTKQIEELNAEVNKLKEQGVNVEVISEEDEANKKIAYLTFDDGPSHNTIKILDFLKANNIQATFFVLGKEGYDDVYKRIVEEGHALALHSNTHDYAEIYQTVDTFMADIESLSGQMEELTGVVSKVLRFPGGSNNRVSHRYGGSDLMSKIIPAMEAEGYVYFDWNVDSQDAAKGLQDKNVIVNSVLSQAKYQKNAVILMHDAAAKTTTVDALPEIVEGLKAQGFVFRGLTVESAPVQFK